MEDKIEFIDEVTGRSKVFEIFTYFCLALSLVSTISYMVYVVFSSNNIINQIVSIISVIILAIFSVLYVVMGMFASSKRVKIFLIIGSLLLSIYSIIQIIIGVTAPKDFVLNFTNKDIKDVVSWAEERNILIEQEFKNSDTIKKYFIISQDVKTGTPTKKVKKIKVVVSDGVDISVNTEVTSMIGWDLDKVISFIDENHLTNVTINFEFSNTVTKDKIISQDVIREIKRDEPITLVSSLGKEKDLKSVTLDNLVGLDTFHALVYCGRNHLNCTTKYVYNEDKEEGTVLKQSIKKWTVITPQDDDKIILTIAKKNEITVPNLTNMSATEITTWATNNRLKVEISEEYDEAIKAGKVISSNYIEDNIVKVGDTIKVTLSKGQLRMIKFTTVDDFTTWANEKGIVYSIDYKYSDSVDSGNLISASHKENQLVKNTDTIKLVISQGGNTTVPNLIGMTKTEVEIACKKAKIICLISGNSNPEYNKVIKQSMRSGSNVPTNTTVTVTLGE